MEGLEPVVEHIASLPEHREWVTIPLNDLPPPALKAAVRLNSLGSLYSFATIVLGNTRFSPDFHKYLCKELEQERLQISLEVPRDHFKTTVASVSAPMWWALPFTENDEALMRSLGYGDAWIRWMYRAHSVSTRTLIASEVIGNARKIGTKISGHYESNDVFRYLFPEIKPKGDERWNQDSMTHRRADGVYHGEGTYDFIGVKGALQSRHYDRQVIDDPVGEKAINSDIVMEGTIDWIRKLPGASDSDPRYPGQICDQLFIGNRWSHRDVGSWLRTNVPHFRFITHAATGSCGDRGCKLHRNGVPIFPEEFTISKLEEIRQIEGAYNFQCQFENNPIAPEAVRFKKSWLRWYSLAPWTTQTGQPEVQFSNSQQWRGNEGAREIQHHMPADYTPPGAEPQRNRMAIQHECRDGEVIEDTRAGVLDRVLIMDPNHSGEAGRSRNAIIVLGFYKPFGSTLPKRIYLLDSWAEASDHSKWIDMAIGNKPERRGLALKWRVHSIYIESRVAGQQGWEHLLKEKSMNLGLDFSFSIRPLKTDRSANAKHTRIVSMEAVYENGLLWLNRNPETNRTFLSEYEEYPNGSTLDNLDLMGYAPQTWGAGSRSQARDFVAAEVSRRHSALQQIGKAGY